MHDLCLYQVNSWHVFIILIPGLQINPPWIEISIGGWGLFHQKSNFNSKISYLEAIYKYVEFDSNHYDPKVRK